MASQPRPEIPSRYWFEFDAVNKILLTRLEGCVTEELVHELYRATPQRWIDTGARASITDCSFVTEVALSPDFIREIARRESAVESVGCPRVIVAPSPSGFGLGRMYQLTGEMNRPMLKVVHTMDEALAALRVRSSHFEPLE